MACNLISMESFVKFGIVVALIWLSAGTRNTAFAVAKCIDAGKAFIDLGADFRLESEEEYTEWYGGTFLEKNFTNRQFTDFLNFSEIKSRAKSFERVCSISGVWRWLATL